MENDKLNKKQFVETKTITYRNGEWIDNGIAVINVNSLTYIERGGDHYIIYINEGTKDSHHITITESEFNKLRSILANY